MADPLTLLRDFTKSGEPVTMEGEEIVFGSVGRFNRSTPTAFHSLKGKGEPYSLGAVWFMLQHADSKFAEYVIQCSKYSMQRVSLVDKKELLEYLHGNIETSNSIKESLLTTSGSLSSSTFNKDLTSVSSLKRTDREEDLEHEKVKRAKHDRGKELSNIEKEEAITHSIITQERPLKSRISILSSEKSNFRDILDVMRRVRAAEDKEQEQNHRRKAKERAKNSRYKDVEENKFWKGHHTNTEEFQIDTRGTFAFPTTTEIDTSIPVVPPVQSTHQTKETSSSRRRSSNSSSSRRSSSSSSSSSFSSSSSSSSDSTSKKIISRTETIPIIIVPSAITAMLTLYNVKSFLEKSVFKSSVEVKKGGGKKQPLVKIYRNKGNGQPPVEYHVLDNVSKLSSKDWRRVVAVFAQGAAWQFKDWRWPSALQTFSRVKGFYLRYDGAVIPDTIKSWDVKVLNVNKRKRHLDVTAVTDFWAILDTFIPKRNPHLVH